MRSDNNSIILKQKLAFQIGYFISLYGLALILLWVGVFKFTATEATAIRPLMESHPFLSWTYDYMGEQSVSNIIGVIEILTAICILISPFKWFFRVSASIGVIFTFLFTLSFLFTKENGLKWIEGVPIVDFFILKDLVYIGFGGILITFSDIMKIFKNTSH